MAHHGGDVNAMTAQATLAREISHIEEQIANSSKQTIDSLLKRSKFVRILGTDQFANQSVCSNRNERK